MRELPHDSAAEQQILGTVLLDPDRYPELAAELLADDLYAENHRILWDTFGALHRSGRPVDFTSITAELKTRGQLDRSGGPTYLAELFDCVTTTGTAAYYLRLVKAHAVKRRLVMGMTRIIELAGSDQDTDTLISAAYQELEGITQSTSAGSGAILTLAQMAEIYSRYVTDLQRNRFSTGFDELDGVIKGVAPGETLFITAYSGLYKSALLQNILLGACRRTGLHHLFFSMEMPATRVFERTVQIGLGRYTYNIESEFHHHNHEKRAETMLELAGINANKLLVCEIGGLTVEKIEHYTRLARAKHGQIGAIGIDYLGLMGADSKSEYERISYVAENSKALAKRLHVPVILLTQINRSAAVTGQMEMHSAKGSGAIEASADYLLGLQRDRDGTVLVKVLKNRNGEAGSIFEAYINKSFLQFRSITPSTTGTSRDAQRGQDRTKKKVVNFHGNDDGDPY